MPTPCSQVAVYIDLTWIEWFIQGGRYAQTLAVPFPALNGSAEQGVVFFTNASSDAGVWLEEATAWPMRSIWRNQTTHDRPGPP